MGEKESRQIIELFNNEGVKYKLYEHVPAYTSKQASKVRGVELKTGVKSMVVKSIDCFLLADIAADRRLDFKKLEMLLQMKKLEFATKDEVVIKTGCEAGSVHPIGWLFNLDTCLDESVLSNEYVSFNVGLLTKSVRIRKDDLVRILKPKLTGSFSKQ